MNKKISIHNIDSLVLVLVSSCLLGIWAAKETIALRNILLVVGSLIGIYYIFQQFKRWNLKEQCDLWRISPIIFLGLTFFWVLCHFIFFSIDPIQQFNELSGVWLRSFMASILGLATGLALRNHPNRLNLLWLGILVAFIILFYQYIPRALAQEKLLVPDYSHYLFHLKINTVLMGMILLAGINGALFDHLRSIEFQWHYFRLSYLFYWLIGTVMVLWSFVFIVDSRNGIGLSTILYSFWFVCVTIIFIRGQMKQVNLKGWLTFLFAAAGLLLILYFGFLQTKENAGWANLISDAKIAVQIDRYQHWQNPAKLGYPKRENGQFVTPNTYERVAWATAGSRAIIENPLGVGVLSFPLAIHPNPPPQMPIKPGALGIATHSGWVDIGLAFGIPILILIFGTLSSSLTNAIRGTYPAKMTILGFIILIFSLYALGEIATNHGLEILFFLLALIPAFMLTSIRVPNNDL